MLCQESYRCADGTGLAKGHRSLLGQTDMVRVPLEMCLMAVKLSAGTLAQSSGEDCATERLQNFGVHMEAKYV